MLNAKAVALGVMKSTDCLSESSVVVDRWTGVPALCDGPPGKAAGMSWARRVAA